jgi:hypothetical protein
MNPSTIDAPTTNALNNNIILNSAFLSMNGVLNFCHFNAQSFNSHFDLINNNLSGVPLHIIGVSETWFSDSNVPRHLSGFKLFHKDRRNDRRFRGGGVALFVSDNINTGRVIKSPDNSLTDYIFVELINGDGTKMLVGVVYNPPAISWHSNIKSAFEDIAGNFLDVLILGDFNLGFLRPTNETINFKDFLFSLDFHNIIQYPTHFVGNSSSLIDLVITTLKKKILP